MDPRISFSNDFADPHQTIKYESNYREAPVSSDFQFSVSNFAMIPADEIFFKGMLLPSNQERKMTLREELLVDDDDFEDAMPRWQKGSGWWRNRLGLKKAPSANQRSDVLHHEKKVFEQRTPIPTPMFVHEEEELVTNEK